MAFTISYNIKAIDQFSAVAKRINDSITDISNSVNKASKGNKNLSRSFGVVSAASSAATSRVNKQNDELRKLRTQSRSSAFDSTMLSDKFRAQSSALSGLNSLVRRNAAASKLATQKQRALNRSIADGKRKMNAANRSLRERIQLQRQIGHGMNRFGGLVNTRVTLPLLAAGGASVKFAMDFNKTMANVGTLIPGQTEKLKQYKKEVLDLSVQYGKSAEVVSAGLYQVISNVGDTSDSMEILAIANKAAVAGVAETADAVNLLTGISSDYGNVSAGMVQHLSDLAFKTVELGSTTFPELAMQMGKTTTLASTLGISVEELFGSYAGLTSGTVRTAQVSTRLAGVMRALLNGTGDLGDTFEKLGVQSGDQLIKKYGGLQNALFAVRREVGNNEVAFSKLFVDQEAKLAALALTGAKSKEAAREIKLMSDVAGASGVAFREQSDGINKAGFKMQQSIQRIKRMAITIGDRLLPQVEKLLIAAEPWIDYLSKIDQGTINAALSAAKWTAIIGVGAKAIGASLNMISWGQHMRSVDGMSASLGGLGKSAGGVAGIIGKGGILLTAFAAGWGAGSEIFNYWNNAMDNLLTRAQNTASRIGMMVTKMSEVELDVKFKEMGQLKKEQDSLMTGVKALFTGRLEEWNEARTTTRQAQIDILAEKLKRMKVGKKDAMEKNTSTGQTSAQAHDMDFTTGPLSKALAGANKDVLEVRIKTDSGTSADVKHRKKGRFSNVNVGRN